jgi:hypothetical protein
MGSTDKDRSLKREALLFCISQGIVPYLEVPIAEKAQLGSSLLLTTDIDVLGLSFDWTGRTRRTLFDCKMSKESPINRALWAAGLISHLELDEGYVIVRRAAAPTHQLTAERRSIYLFDKESFIGFAKFYEPNSDANNSYLSDLIRHDEIAAFFNAKSPLHRLYGEVAHASPLQIEPGLGIRRIISRLAEIRGELDPKKRAHVYILCEITAAMSIFLFDFLSRTVRLIGAKFSEQEYNALARNLIWGGRDNYEEKKQIRQLAFPNEELEFPAWNEFVRMTSTLLVAVSQMSAVPLIMRNFGTRMAGEIKPEGEIYLKRLFSQAPRARQIIFAILRYIKASTGIPSDFVIRLESEVNHIIDGTSMVSVAQTNVVKS